MKDTWTLTLKNVQTGDRGPYMCQVRLFAEFWVLIWFPNFLLKLYQNRFFPSNDNFNRWTRRLWEVKWPTWRSLKTILLILDFFFWILIFSEKAFEDQWHFSGCDSANDRGHWVLTRPGKYKPIIFVLFVCLSNVSKLFYLSCTVPTQIIFKSYLPIYQNDIRLFTTIITGGAWRRFCKTQLQGAWFSTVSFFDHRKKILLCPSFAQNIFLLCSTIAQNILLFCSTLTQNRIFKFVHLMCKIEFLGWSKSCTK